MVDSTKVLYPLFDEIDILILRVCYRPTAVDLIPRSTVLLCDKVTWNIFASNSTEVLGLFTSL